MPQRCGYRKKCFVGVPRKAIRSTMRHADPRSSVRPAHDLEPHAELEARLDAVLEPERRPWNLHLLHVTTVRVDRAERRLAAALEQVGHALLGLLLRELQRGFLLGPVVPAVEVEDVLRLAVAGQAESHLQAVAAPPAAGIFFRVDRVAKRRGVIDPDREVERLGVVHRHRVGAAAVLRLCGEVVRHEDAARAVPISEPTVNRHFARRGHDAERVVLRATGLLAVGLFRVGTAWRCRLTADQQDRRESGGKEAEPCPASVHVKVLRKVRGKFRGSAGGGPGDVLKATR